MWHFLEDHKCDIASYSDEDSPYRYDVELNVVISKLEDWTI